MPFPHLLSPLEIRGIRLPNRMIMGSMHLGYEAEANAFERLATFYAARAKGGIGLIVTGGVAPNPEGTFGPDGTVLANESGLAGHGKITAAVHGAGGRIVMQILHCGRYGRHKDIVAPSAIRAPISSVVPREMSEDDIVRTIAEYAATAHLAKAAGYDGVEVMASEGYLVNAFLTPRTNKRADRWGGSLENRTRFAVEIVRAVRQSLGDDRLLLVRLSMVDLVEDGLSADEVTAIAQSLEAAGADILNSGIGWHESRVPTIAHTVPAGAWTWATARVKAKVGIPVAASNRIKTPEQAEALLARGEADLVSMARPLLADPDFAAKTAKGRADAITACIGCNQGCLDPIFSGGSATCLVNPRAGREAEFTPAAITIPRRIAVIGGGPAGLAAALEAARRGHRITLFEAEAEPGGQFRLARIIPGKEEYTAIPKAFARNLTDLGAEIRLGQRAGLADIKGFDAVILATGITPRRLDLPGADHAKVVAYDDILAGRVQAGERVAILGCGGIGFDTALYLLGQEEVDPGFNATWGIDPTFAAPGGLTTAAAPKPIRRKIVMMQRKADKPGSSLGKTTGWIHKAHLQRHAVEMLSGVSYISIDDAGLHIRVGEAERLIEADTIITCIGQDSCRDLAAPLQALGVEVHVIGGARDASKIDALAAFEDGTRLGLAV
ncbi:2,4-dienoyl-CoA reductase (NADPH) [Candidatus Terasakiella magnetica]|nr:2,4-dienoyl-CoA reductase (NADPH) [Candidatus Terasakiella magnetica]